MNQNCIWNIHGQKCIEQCTVSELKNITTSWRLKITAFLWENKEILIRFSCRPFSRDIHVFLALKEWYVLCGVLLWQNMIDCIYVCEQRENFKANVCSGNHSLSFVISSLSLLSKPLFFLFHWRKAFLGTM